MADNIPTTDFTAPRKTHHWLLDAIGIGLLVILALSAWFVVTPYKQSAVLPLGIIAYAAWNIIFELTWNRHNVPTMATGFVARRHVVRAMTKLSRETAASRAGKPFTIIDLGSGHGEISRLLGRTVPDAQVIGIEIARVPYQIAKCLLRWFGPANVAFERLDFGPYDCTKADAVYMYLSGKMTREVGEKLWRELRPGSAVITHTFQLGGDWTPAEIITFRNPFKERLYIYKK